MYLILISVFNYQLCQIYHYTLYLYYLRHHLIPYCFLVQKKTEQVSLQEQQALILVITHIITMEFVIQDIINIIIKGKLMDITHNLIKDNNIEDRDCHCWLEFTFY